MSKQNNTQEFPSYINSLKGFMDHDEGRCLNKHAIKSSEHGPILEMALTAENQQFIWVSESKVRIPVFIPSIIIWGPKKIKLDGNIMMLIFLTKRLEE